MALQRSLAPYPHILTHPHSLPASRESLANLCSRIKPTLLFLSLEILLFLERSLMSKRVIVELEISKIDKFVVVSLQTFSRALEIVVKRDDDTFLHN